MRIGLLTQWYDPEPGPAALPGVLARGLVGRGHEVTVLTGFPNYPSGTVADGYRLQRHLVERLDGATVHRVALFPSHDGSSVRRALNYASFGASTVLNGLGALRGLDAVWVNYSPVTIGGAQLAAKALWGVPSVVHVLDLWPDTMFAGGFAGEGRPARLLGTGVSAWCRALYGAASSVAYISPGVGDVLRERGVPSERLHFVPMWADEEVFRPCDDDLRDELGLSPDQVVLLYAGAMGDAQGLDSLVEACRLVDDPRFVCLLAGSGVAEGRLRRSAEGVANVRFIGRVPQQEMTRLVATGDISYVGLRRHALSPVTMPSKTQAAMASGRPLLVAAEGDVARLVTEGEIGFVADPSSATSIAAAIREAVALGRPGLSDLGRRARKTYDECFSVTEGVTRIEGLLEGAAQGKGRR